MFKKLLLFIFITNFPIYLKAAEQFQLSAAEWAQPKRAETVLQMSAIRNGINELNKNEKNRLTIRYPGGESGILWASELKGWLVSLGVDSNIIDMQPGSTKSNVLDLTVVPQK